jgi:hypothetical protein
MGVALLTYVALADRLKCSPKAARSLAKRLRLPTQRGDDGKFLVSVDPANPLIRLATVATMDDEISAWLARRDGHQDAPKLETKWIVKILRPAYESGSIVNNSWGCDTPRRAYRPTETRRRFMSPTLANAADIRTG